MKIECLKWILFISQITHTYKEKIKKNMKFLPYLNNQCDLYVHKKSTN